MNAEGEIRRAKSMYVDGTIDVEALERRVWDALTGVWSPTSAMVSVLKEQWTDAPGGVLVYSPTVRDFREDVERLREKLDRVHGDLESARLDGA